MSSNVRNPPMLEDGTLFETWEKKVELWQTITDLKAEKQGPALVLALSDKNQEHVLKLKTAEIKAQDGVQKILEKLGKVFLQKRHLGSTRIAHKINSLCNRVTYSTQDKNIFM